jgi:hypothetical protein
MPDVNFVIIRLLLSRLSGCAPEAALDANPRIFIMPFWVHYKSEEKT